MEERRYFQAVGYIQGRILASPELGYHIEIKGRETSIFPIKINRHAYYRFRKNFISSIKEKPLYFLVYPKSRFGEDRLPQLWFEVLGWTEEKPNAPINEFIIRGVWQFIPQSRRPVVSVGRNYKGKEHRNKLLKQGQKFGSAHIPVLWRDSPVDPFRFNPKIKRERFFVELKAKFLPDKKTFGFSSLLAPPTLEIPKALKNPKPTAEEQKKAVPNSSLKSKRKK